MQPTSAEALERASTRLAAHLRQKHWNGKALVGPDHGIRFNARIWRFVKGYLDFVPWGDDLVYAQAQRYWIHANWMLHDLALDEPERCREIAQAASDYLLRAQRPEGYWEYPNPEWRGRIATVEGNYASLGLLETFERTGDERYVDAADRWYRYVVERIGFIEDGETLAVNYFGNVPGGRVPNNSASALTTFATLAKCTGDSGYLRRCRPMVAFLASCQFPSGELPYAVAGGASRGKPHFLCYQYNAFQFLNLAEYHRLTGDEEIQPVLEGLVRYLRSGLTSEGAGRYDCRHDRPEVPYYTAAIAAALSLATSLRLGDHSRQTDAAFARLLSQQGANGSFFFSAGNYGVLSDRRSYPRNLAMILCHLLAEVPSAHSRETMPRFAGGEQTRIDAGLRVGRSIMRQGG